MDSISFWSFIKKYQIEIPIIQRDYAQGRTGKEKLREGFLTNLKQALDGKLPHDETVLKLDFVYGATEKGHMLPLDGQQRLTTLWLIHWYIALRSGNFQDACDVLLRFTYKTRISSRDFCEKMCDPTLFERFNPGKQGITDYITKQTWFYSAWKQDPTVKSMLTMLKGTKTTNKKGIDIIDGIEELFERSTIEDFEHYWSSLTSESGAPIVFYHLDLEDFGLSDDLYIKMNARGKQLTAFENFKADLIGYLNDRESEAKEQEDKDVSEWESLLDVKKGLPLKLDTVWTDIFWCNKSQGLLKEDNTLVMSNQIDGIYLAFINRFFWDALFMEKDSSEKFLLPLGEGVLPDGSRSYTIEASNPSYKYLNEDRYDLYSDLEPYKYTEKKDIPLAFFKKLSVVLDRVASYSGKWPTCKWDKEFRFIPEYVLDNNGYNLEVFNAFKDSYLKCTSLTQTQRIVFHSIVKYFEEGEGETISFEKWLRVVWNLISGEGTDGRPQIRSTQAVRTAIEFIDKLDSHNVYESLKNLEGSKWGTSDFDKRCREEVIKAIQIQDGTRNDGETWESIITNAENTAFFKGAIRFLYQDKNGNVDWPSFDTKFKNAKTYFDDNRLFSYSDLRYFIGRCESEQEIRSIIYDIRPYTWMANLMNEDLMLPVSEFLNVMPEDNPQCWSLKDSILNSKLSSAVKDIVDSDLLSEMTYWGSHVDDCHFRDDLYGLTALLPYNAKSEQKKFVIGHFRNSFLSQLIINKVIESGHKINNCNYFWGWDIWFRYNNQTFLWDRYNWIYIVDEASQYLQVENESGSKQYAHFIMDEQKDSFFFLNHLDELIKKLTEANHS